MSEENWNESVAKKVRRNCFQVFAFSILHFFFIILCLMHMWACVWVSINVIRDNNGYNCLRSKVNL